MKQRNINAYIINWLIGLLDQRKQRVVAGAEKGGPGLPKYFFRAFGHQFGLKIKEGGPLPWIRHCDGYRTKYVFFNRGVPHCTALGLILFSIVINDIKAINTNRNLLVKFGGDITVSLPIEVNVGLDESETKILSFIEWSEN